jgi:hypothetical protein
MIKRAAFGALRHLHWFTENLVHFGFRGLAIADLFDFGFLQRLTGCFASGEKENREKSKRERSEKFHGKALLRCFITTRPQ